ncbi:flavoprotein [Irpex rosettiformis]|uniref:Flavoprotein n=1 Tax=Irpex rosettiformis TaxID=378272 RepID=A0ACB8TTE6_9APHY|nr:flavoprotein [Irpex rosettiformis]
MAKPLFISEEERTDGFTHVVLILSGSVASIKAPLIVSELLTYDKVKVEVVATNASLTFFSVADIENAGARVWKDEDEWLSTYKIGDPILHIELRRWADIVLVAPCSANTLSKIAHGLCDNLATSLLRALAPTTPTYLFPAMNTLMYEHPLTNEHLRVVKEVIGYTVIGPIGKTLACGDVGLGAMTEWKDIVQLVADQFSLVRINRRTSTT